MSTARHLCCIALAGCALAGCGLFRVSELPARRYLAAPWPAGTDPAPPKQADARRVRLLPVDARGLLRQDLTLRLADGERRLDSVWRWTEAPHRFVEIHLAHRLERVPDLVLCDDPDAVALKVVLLDCLVDTAAHRVELAAKVVVYGGDGALRTRLVKVGADWQGELPGDLAARTSDAIGLLVERVIAFVLE